MQPAIDVVKVRATRHVAEGLVGEAAVHKERVLVEPSLVGPITVFVH